MPWPLASDGPFWPWLMAVALGLTIWGAVKGQAAIPALSLLGYIAMRLVVNVTPPQWLEVVSCTLWLCIASAMVYKGGGVPAFFYALSALTYPVFLLVGYRLVHLGLSPVVSEGFAILALLSIGGGLYGVVPHTVGDTDRLGDGGRAVAARVSDS